MERYAKNGCASLALIPYLHDGSWQGDDKKRHYMTATDGLIRTMPRPIQTTDEKSKT